VPQGQGGYGGKGGRDARRESPPQGEKLEKNIQGKGRLSKAFDYRLISSKNSAKKGKSHVVIKRKKGGGGELKLTNGRGWENLKAVNDSKGSDKGAKKRAE